MMLPNWLCKKNRKTVDEILVEIEDHRENIRMAGVVVDKMVAALDGEDHWIDCSCFDRSFKKERRKQGNRQNAISHS
jgi:hypothetical protein